MEPKKAICPICKRTTSLHTITEQNRNGLCDECLAKSRMMTDVSGGSGTPGKTAHLGDIGGS